MRKEEMATRPQPPKQDSWENSALVLQIPAFCSDQAIAPPEFLHFREYTCKATPDRKHMGDTQTPMSPESGRGVLKDQLTLPSNFCSTTSSARHLHQTCSPAVPLQPLHDGSHCALGIPLCSSGHCRPPL